VESFPFELRVLGPTELRGSKPELDDPNLRPPKRLALLTWLAVETADGFRRRDQIVGLFWPELGQDGARTQLRKALFCFRESLGPDAVISRGEGEVRLDPGRVWCDAVALDLYTRQRRWAEALALYRGELLEGLFAEGTSQELDEWLRDQRRRFRELAAVAAWGCSLEEEARDDRKAAAVMARRALELTPDDEGGVRQLMSLLDRQGDRGGALRVYREWQARLQAEYGVEPAPETRKLARKVQAARKGESHETPPVPQAESPEPPPQDSAPALPHPTPRSRNWARLSGVGGALLAVTLLALALTRIGCGRDVPSASLAVLPFRVIGDTALTAVAEGIAEELTTALVLDSSLAVRSTSRARDAVGAGGDVERIGRRLRVAYVVDGGVQRGVGRVRLTLRLVRSGDAVAVWAGFYDLAENSGVTDAQRAAADAATAIRARLRAPGAPVRP
jgi:DNA-binding SARP family transcriptional activator/TolB-like protein